MEAYEGHINLASPSISISLLYGYILCTLTTVASIWIWISTRLKKNMLKKIQNKNGWILLKYNL